MTMTNDWIAEARKRLLDLQRGPGVWGYRARSSPAVEATSLASLALQATEPGSTTQSHSDSIRRSSPTALASARWLASIRQADGSLGVTLDLSEPGWATPFAMLLWASVGGFEPDRAASLGWLIQLKGKAIVQAKGDPMGHDATLVGWPWVSDTHSWVEPSAIAMLAMAREGKSDHPRTREGVRLLVDRAIPGGGWNLGNPIVFGTPLRPLPGPSGLAMLALANLDRPSKVSKSAISYLQSALGKTLAPVSLGWGLLGLRAWGFTPTETSVWLARSFDQIGLRDLRVSELALLLLAAGHRSMDLLGLRPRDREVTCDG